MLNKRTTLHGFKSIGPTRKRPCSSNDTGAKHPYMTQNFWVKKLERDGDKMPVSTAERILAIIDGFKFQPEHYRKP